MRKKINYIFFTILLLILNFNYVIAEDTIECKDIINGEIQDIINTYMTWIRILVPIALIIFGILDFGRAVFASKEDDMKKAQETFTKRLIVGVIIFFVPTLVNLIIYLINESSGLFGNASCGIK